LTLEQVIATSMLANPQIRTGLESINLARADLITSSLRPNPDLSVNGTLLPLNRSFTVDAQGGPPQVGADIAYPIDWLLFGKRAAAMASARVGVAGAEADYADLIRTQVSSTIQAYYDLLEAKALLGLARQDVEDLRRVAASTAKAVEAGGRSQVDLNRVQLDLLNSERTLRDAQTAVVAAQAKLRAFLGRKDSDPAFDVLGDLEAALTPAAAPTVEQAFALGEQNRPDIASLRLQLDKAARDIDVEKTKAYPPVTPKIGYIRQIQQKANGFPDVNLWEFSVDVNLPLSDRNQGNIAKARTMLAQNTYKLETALVGLRSEIEQAVQDFRVAAVNAGPEAAQRVKLARDVRDAIEKAYKAGGRSLLELLDAQRNYRDTYRMYISGRANYYRSAVRLNAATGRRVVP
jgi:cobalt-zinc-cadmium efflux system outer membrane protein